MNIASFTTAVSAEGQVILSKVILDRLHWAPGTRLAVEHMAEGVLLRVLASDFLPTQVEDVFGCLSCDGEQRSLEETDAGAATEVWRRYDTDPAQKMYPDMPNHAASEAEFLALVDEGLADVDEGRTVLFEIVAADLRLKMADRS